MYSCSFCNNQRPNTVLEENRWWFLRGYLGFTGYCCPDCWEMIRFDSQGNHKNPEAFAWFMLKHSEKFSVSAD